MAFTELERTACEIELSRYIERRRPRPEIRPKLDIGFSIDKQSVEIFEIRPTFKNPAKYHHESVAKARYVRTQHEWRVYWMRADLKWHPYDPCRATRTLAGFLRLVDKDNYGCFWG